MRGMDFIIKTRKAGYRPAHVVLDFMPYDAENLPNWLQIEKNDSPELTDLRPLVGLVVTVFGPSVGIAERWGRAVMAANAKTVLIAPLDEPGRIARLEGVDQ